MRSLKQGALYSSFCLLALCQGCGTTIQSYNTQFNKTLTPYVAEGVYEDTVSAMRKLGEQENNGILWRLELARLEQLEGNYEKSEAILSGIAATLNDHDYKPIVDLSEVAANVQSLAANDNVIPYLEVMPAYERVFVHQFRMFNFLKAGDLEGAGVEVRRANELQQAVLEQHAKMLAQLEADSQAHSIDLQAIDTSLSEQFQSLDELAASVKNSFQNAYTFYLSGLIYELRGETNDAYIDYKKCLEIAPDNVYVQERVLTLAESMNMEDDLHRYRETYGEAAEFGARSGDEAAVVVLYEDGWVPQKQAIRIPLPGPNGSIGTAAFPIYSLPKENPAALSVRIDSAQTIEGSTTSVCDVRALAVRSLKERAASIAVREVFRNAMMAGIHSGMQNQNDMYSAFVSLYDAVVSQADLRAWYSLPQSVQILRFNVAPGSHEIHFSSASGLHSIQTELKAKDIKIFRVINIGSRTIVHEIY